VEQETKIGLSFGWVLPTFWVGLPKNPVPGYLNPASCLSFELKKGTLITRALGNFLASVCFFCFWVRSWCREGCRAVNRQCWLWGKIHGPVGQT